MFFNYFRLIDSRENKKGVMECVEMWRECDDRHGGLKTGAHDFII
jgi:hypothetical protein